MPLLFLLLLQQGCFRDFPIYVMNSNPLKGKIKAQEGINKVIINLIKIWFLVKYVKPAFTTLFNQTASTNLLMLWPAL